jgi:hypothetical protein
MIGEFKREFIPYPKVIESLPRMFPVKKNWRVGRIFARVEGRLLEGSLETRETGRRSVLQMKDIPTLRHCLHDSAEGDVRRQPYPD